VSFLRHPFCLHNYDFSDGWIDLVDQLPEFHSGRKNARRGDFGLQLAVSEVSVPSFDYQSLRKDRPFPWITYDRRGLRGKSRAIDVSESSLPGGTISTRNSSCSFLAVW
jgi:hypothetical protein